MREIEELNRKSKELMIEGAKKTAEESSKITKESETIDREHDWEW